MSVRCDGAELDQWLGTRLGLGVAQISGAYAHTFVPTGLGCVIKVRNTETGDETDLTDRAAW